MSTPRATMLSYYSCTGVMTDPGPYRDIYAGLPSDISALCAVVQGLLVHVFWAERYGLKLSDERKQEVQIRPVADKLDRILELDPSPLTVARPLDRRLVGNCRDFTLLLTSMLQCQGIPARARCGFGTYFMPNHYEDHWVCEYWNTDEGRWVMMDSQLDSLQREALGIRFDVLDVPPGAFVNGGRAWQACRRGDADPESFGIFDMHGLWFVRGDLVRDFLALNKIEILPWDYWGVMTGPDDEVSEIELMDRLAALCADPDRFEEARAFYESAPDLHPPAEILPPMQRERSRQ